MPPSGPFDEVVSGARVTIAAVDYASIIIRAGHDYHTVAFTHREILDLEAHYLTDQCPAISATLTGRIARIGTTARHCEWPSFRAACHARGIMSVAAFPITIASLTRGALNLYSTDHHAFGTAETRAGRQFAEHAAAHLLATSSFDPAPPRPEHNEKQSTPLNAGNSPYGRQTHSAPRDNVAHKARVKQCARKAIGTSYVR